MKLLCLPHAGGSAAVYARWTRLFGPGVRVVPVEYPGHGRRLREPLHISAATLVDRLVEELRPLLREGPFAVFGHSMGGLLAFRFTHELVRRGLPLPARLFLSAARPPGHPATAALHTLDDAGLVAALAELGGAPPEVLADPEFVRTLLPVVRADLLLAETWAFRPPAPLDVPVSVLSGLADPLAPPGVTAGWRPHFAGAFARRAYPGGHFFPFDAASGVPADLRQALGGAAQGTFSTGRTGA
ncbi:MULTISPECIES: thioesterase II family protein [Streptomyces]|uniref:Alpha/beta fold hydrolase n=1 Tax=Streptomyces solicathayae TaxID=3081768 RepID=A0ABZ0M4N8_9ACTN|nr:alpha/beta fold hydrolase [Streptomyces sp. HUAS YS2]WOX25994.1 alpha/beta fold hydrolase [Streptomyces sp. HUAS YS2]